MFRSTLTNAKYDPEIKERARLLYMERTEPRRIREALNIPVATVYKWIKVGGWSEEREKKEAKEAELLRLNSESNKLGTLLAQHSIYSLIEDVVNKRLLNIVAQLKDKDDAHYLEELSLLDIVKYFPPMFKDSREVFQMKQEFDEIQAKKNNAIYDQKQIMENPRLLALFMQAREAQEKLIAAIEAVRMESPNNAIRQNLSPEIKLEEPNQN